ncbi:DUF4230 domain-containing protein [Isoptericola variabilis]|uniref:Secreted protein n=1 Tax=Isoptericola variabilis (strain 225) TaxID=743718 RepID=F6FPE6_ISOV2|nr:DUF4230 domain-containing protein [Isoptericola variabilis]AEG43659.1 hypothetical protein Isova_0875 [Isoptericola variabilis 225]TWH27340.1 uncharacterized protein DUF4230 [Isoptericola variabilis J7]
MRAAVVAVLATIGVVAVLLVLAFGALRSGLVSLPGNPFQTEQVDRSETPVLLGIQDLSRFVAAEATFQVVLDLEEDTRFVPDWLMGERTIFIAHGSVEAYVDFRDLDEESIEISEDGTAVTVTVPAPELADPRIDLSQSRALSESRGLINRVEDFFAEDADSRQETLLKAEEMLVDAAEASDVKVRAEENTRKTLEGLITGLGFESVEVDFEDAGAGS